MMRANRGSALWSMLVVALLPVVAAASNLSATLATGVAASPRAPGPPPTITVFAAASLTEVLGTLGQRYTASSGQTVRFSFAGTPLLARQVEAGAAVDLFVSADEEWMDWLERRRLVVPGSRVDLAENRLVLVAPRPSRVTLRLEPGAPLLDALGRDGRLAVADPDVVPAGRYARAALSALGVWSRLEPRLARAENVRAALAFVARGETPLGIVYATDARVEPRVRVVAEFPPGSHPPIRYPAALVGGRAAEPFLRFLRGPEALETFRTAGFGTPPASRTVVPAAPSRNPPSGSP